MQVIVNGEKHTVRPKTNVLELLERLKLSPERIAVEIDLTVIKREVYHATTLKEGDRIEIISFIGGGAHAG
ncbi:MAG: sulfur carrier protein ThiS [Nitrospiria bacterium]